MAITSRSSRRNQPDTGGAIHQRPIESLAPRASDEQQWQIRYRVNDRIRYRPERSRAVVAILAGLDKNAKPASSLTTANVDVDVDVDVVTDDGDLLRGEANDKRDSAVAVELDVIEDRRLCLIPDVTTPGG